jgi:hypothetical protein
VSAAARDQRFTDAQAADRSFTDHFLTVHLHDFPPAQPPVVPPPDAIDEQALDRQFEHEAVKDVAWFRRTERREARARARQRATVEAARQTTERQAELERQQQEADQQWGKLNDNDPATVIGTLEAAFEHLQMAVAPLDCSGRHVTLLIRFPPVEGVVPSGTPSLTPSGRPTVKRRTKSETNQAYARAIFSHALAAGREALASCPCLNDASVIAVAGGENAASPLAPLAAVRIDRPTADASDWPQSPDAAVAALRFERLMLIKGQAGELAPLSLVDQPELRRVVELVAEHLGVPVDPRCGNRLREGQVQQFVPTA